MIRIPHLLILSVALVSTWSPLRAEILVKSGDKIAFLGDSITAGRLGQPDRLRAAGHRRARGQWREGRAGARGHQRPQVQPDARPPAKGRARQEAAVDDAELGVNDVWHGKGGVPLDDEMAKNEIYNGQADLAARGTYKKNITEIVEKAQAAGVKPVILTATVIQEQLDNDLNKKLAPVQRLPPLPGQGKEDPARRLEQDVPGGADPEGKPNEKVLTGDGVHMNPAGNRLMATGVLMALGLNDAELKKANEAWAAIVVPPPAPKAAPKPVTAATPAAPAAPAVTSPSTK